MRFVGLSSGFSYFFERFTQRMATCIILVDLSLSVKFFAFGIEWEMFDKRCVILRNDSKSLL